MTDEEIWAVWDEVIGVNTGIDPVPFARAIGAARATAERDSVIEECAKVCDEMSATYARRGENGHSSGAYWCADAIRALKSQQDAAIESKRSGDGS